MVELDSVIAGESRLEWPMVERLDDMCVLTDNRATGANSITDASSTDIWTWDMDMRRAAIVSEVQQVVPSSWMLSIYHLMHYVHSDPLPLNPIR